MAGVHMERRLEAMRDEMSSPSDHGVLKLCELPAGKYTCLSPVIVSLPYQSKRISGNMVKLIYLAAIHDVCYAATAKVDMLLVGGFLTHMASCRWYMP